MCSLLYYEQFAFSVCLAILIYSENMHDKQSVYAYRECMCRVCMGLLSVILFSKTHIAQFIPRWIPQNSADYTIHWHIIYWKTPPPFGVECPFKRCHICGAPVTPMQSLFHCVRHTRYTLWILVRYLLNDEKEQKICKKNVWNQGNSFSGILITPM